MVATHQPVTLAAMEGVTNGQRDPNTHLEHDICIHIFTVSSAMVGVCLTVIGLIRVVITLGRADTLADDLLAGDALLFLISCLLSYWALRSRSLRRMHRLEKIADGIFIIAMIGMVALNAKKPMLPMNRATMPAAEAPAK